MQSTIGRFGPELEKFFYGKMLGGDQGNINRLLGDMNTQHASGQQDLMNKIKASGIPMGSSAMGRAVGGELGRANTDFNVQRGGMMEDMRRHDLGTQFQGAGGLGGMPGYYAAPSSIEAAIFGMKSPYDMANFGARMQDRGSMQNWMSQYGMYQPERVQRPSGFDQYVSPWLNPLMQGAGMALPFSLF